MFLSPDVLRTLLFIGLFSMVLLAALYLRRRDLSFFDYVVLGLIAVFIPLLGPFLIILSRPGKPRPNGLTANHSYRRSF